MKIAEEDVIGIWLTGLICAAVGDFLFFGIWVFSLR
jgi:hypothetical protein